MFRLSVESNSPLPWLCFGALCDSLAKLAPLSQPMRTNRDLLACVFPRLGPITCICFEVLALFTSLVIPKVKFWFYDTQMKTALYSYSCTLYPSVRLKNQCSQGVFFLITEPKCSLQSTVLGLGATVFIKTGGVLGGVALGCLGVGGAMISVKIAFKLLEWNNVWLEVNTKRDQYRQISDRLESLKTVIEEEAKLTKSRGRSWRERLFACCTRT